MFSNGEKMENLANASVHKQGSNYSDDMFAWKWFSSSKIQSEEDTMVDFLSHYNKIITHYKNVVAEFLFKNSNPWQGLESKTDFFFIV